LNALPDADRLTVSGLYPAVLAAQFLGQTVDVDNYDLADYVVTYIAANQRHLTDGVLDAALAERQPVATVTIAGIPYAQVYALEAPSFALPAGRPGALRLHQVQVLSSTTTRGGTVSAQLAWEDGAPGSATPTTDLQAELALIDSDDGLPITTMLVPVVADGQARTWTTQGAKPT